MINENNNQSIFCQTKEVLMSGTKGALSGGLVVMAVSPFLYARNRFMTGKNFIYKDCMKGAPLMATSVVPQAFVALTFDKLFKNILLKGDQSRELTNCEKIASGIFAGMLSGVISTPFEFGALNYQNGWQKSVKKVFSVALKQKGPSVFLTGSVPLMIREAIYTPTYTWGSHYISEKINPYINYIVRHITDIFSQNISEKTLNMTEKTVSKVVGAGIAGVVAGALTTPFDIIRANKQCMERNWSWKKTCKTMGSVIKGSLAARVAACGLATIFMTLGTGD